MTLTRLQITARLVAIIMAVISVATTKAQEIYRVESAPAAVQLRSNGLYDLALCPNIGIEIQTDLGLAWQLDYIGAWWNSPSRNRFFSNYAFQTEIRYYLASPKMTFPYTGHHVGLYGQMITYDFEFGGKGYQSNDLSKTWAIGAAYGYRIPLGKQFAADFTIGIGYLRSKYDVYEPYMGRYIRLNSKRLSYFGPTRLEASLIWNINAKNK